MGHKVNPKIFRVGLSENWSSRWFAGENDYKGYLKQDYYVREYLEKKLRDAGVKKIEIERSPDNLNINIYSSKPGIIIGRGGSGIEEIKKHILKNIIKNKKTKIQINIKEVSKPQLSAQIVAQNMALELEKRIPYRRVMKRNLESVMRAGAKGVKVILAGRLDGVDIARRETLVQGKIPLHTIRAEIDYGTSTASTTYGAVGIKVWVYTGEYFEEDEQKNNNQ